MAASSNSINTGTVSTSGSATRLTGVSSGLDTDSLVNAAYTAKLAPATLLQDKITVNTSKIAAYQTLKTNLATLQAAANALRNPPGISDLATNVFAAKSAYLSSAATSDPTGYVGVDASTSAKTGSYELVIERLATANKQKSAAAPSAGTDLAAAWNGGSSFIGTLNIGLAGGTSASIAVDGTMSLADLKAAIDAKSATTGVSAQIVAVSPTEQRLVLTGNETGKAIQATSDAGGADVASLMGLSDIQAATSAKFSLDGIEFERPSNTVADAVPGLTFSLYAADSTKTMTLSVEQSLSAIKTEIGSFVDAYNAVRDFIATQQATNSDGTYADTAVLHADQMLRSIVTAISGDASAGASGLGSGQIRTLAALGITIDGSNHLVINDATLTSKLTTDPDAVKKIFAFDSTISDANLAVTERGNALTASSFKVQITAGSDGAAQSVSFVDDANGTSYAGIVDGSGYLRGAKGTPFEGLELAWLGSGSATIQVNASQGIADKIYNDLSPVLDSITGTIATNITDIASQNLKYNQRITDITDRAYSYKETLINKYAAMEATLTQLNTLLSSIKAQTSAWNNN